MKNLAIKSLFNLLVFGSLFVTDVASADTKILKWVDKQGTTHYGDRPPSFEESKSNVEMNNRGLVVKKNAPVEHKNEAQDLQQQQQDRKDKILLASYTNANEIDLARDRSLEMNKASMTSLASQKENIAARIARNTTTAEGFKQRNKPLPANLDKEFKDALAQSGRIDNQIADRKLEMVQTHNNYTEDKTRYLILKQSLAANSAAPPTVPTSSATEATTVEKIHIDKK